MTNNKRLHANIFNALNDKTFNDKAIEIFHYQYNNNKLYAEFVKNFSIDVNNIKHYTQIPFLPIEFFKSHKIKSGNFEEEKVFLSSGTSGVLQSKHYVKSLDIYKQSFHASFQFFYGDINEYCIIALLPSYLEREGSSLVYMANDFIKNSVYEESGFYIDDHKSLMEKLSLLAGRKQKTIILGVTFGLLDLAETFSLDFPELIIMETGGMKGRREEMIREDVHDKLKKQFKLNNIHSEYGMTELMSQAYSKGEGKFFYPPWMRILCREINDPLSLQTNHKTGGINIIDLANLYSCSFIASQDLGRTYDDNSFEVLGRFDNSDIRGCNLMAL